MNAHLGGAADLLGATGDLFLTLGRSGQHVRLAQRFREQAVATGDPEQQALGHGILGDASVSSAQALAGEERQARLGEAVAAFREALRFYTPEAAPLNYATTQNNLGLALCNQAGALAGEERLARLGEAVAAYREALRFYTPEAAPLNYATMQNNLGLALCNQAGALAGEERLARLGEAVAAYREALRFYTPEAAPLNYATTQNNLDRVLKAIGTRRPRRLRGPRS